MNDTDTIGHSEPEWFTPSARCNYCNVPIHANGPAMHPMCEKLSRYDTHREGYWDGQRFVPEGSQFLADEFPLGGTA